MNLDTSESFETGRIYTEIKELCSTGGWLLVLNNAKQCNSAAIQFLFFIFFAVNNFSIVDLQGRTFTDNT